MSDKRGTSKMKQEKSWWGSAVPPKFGGSRERAWERQHLPHWEMGNDGATANKYGRRCLTAMPQELGGRGPGGLNGFHQEVTEGGGRMMEAEGRKASKRR